MTTAMKKYNILTTFAGSNFAVRFTSINHVSNKFVSGVNKMMENKNSIFHNKIIIGITMFSP